MNKQIHIYRIYFPTSGKCYIGQAVDVKKRLARHIKSKFPVGYALRKYDNWLVSILHTTKGRDAANLIEIEEIRNHNSIAKNGYNLTRGGEGGDTFTANPNKEKIRQKYIGKEISQETRDKIRIASTGRLHTEATKELLRLNHNPASTCFTGKHHTEAAKEKMRVPHGSPSAEHIEKNRVGHLGRTLTTAAIAQRTETRRRNGWNKRNRV